MTTFDSTKTKLFELLDDIAACKLQLPDFQRGWVWDDEHIRSLLTSIARSFPIGALMLLESGGEMKLQVRPLEGVSKISEVEPEKLILDGQQRLTSLTQVLKLQEAVLTKDEKKREIKRFYYFDIARTLDKSIPLEDCLIAVDENKVLKTDFGRKIVLDLSDIQKEVGAFCFPCNQILNSDAWEECLNSERPERFSDYMKFRKQILNAFRNYLVPVIILRKDTSKEAVCLVFEKVNTGGVPLSVFELVTATYAADNFNLREDWFGKSEKPGRHARLSQKSFLKQIEATDFLQGISLLHTYEKRQAELNAGKEGKELPAVSAKREHVLVTPLQAYQKWAEPLTKGFIETEQFLSHLGFYHHSYLPYRAQLIPLAAALAHLNERWLEPAIQKKLTQWYWCGVFGELYGSATESRIALDFQDILSWTNGGNEEPNTVVAAGFHASRLESLRTRTSAAYRGLFILLQKLGAKDFFWKTRIMDIDRNERGIDIHHIFPKKWCEDKKIPAKIFNSIINKTAISYKANRKIGGRAPSVYLKQIQNDSAVQIDDNAMDEILGSHLVEPGLLRTDDFDNFYKARKQALLEIIENAMGKKAIYSSDVLEPFEGEAEDHEFEND